MSLLLLLACGDKDPGDSTPQDSPVDTSAEWSPPDGGVIELTTQDEVTLVADYYPSEQQGASAVILLHMIPPTWDRSSWPSDFIELLGEQGWTVLVPDRRGAGDSGGSANAAYNGAKGKYDAEACVRRLVDDGYGAVAIVGASNGTTTALDYTLWSQTDETELPPPVALGFMTGGAYTEAQNSMSDLGEIPSIFTFSTQERAWSVEQQALGRSAWVFQEYADGAHGTLMFDAAPEVAQDLLDFLGEHL